jgi:hypothetical protein
MSESRKVEDAGVGESRAVEGVMIAPGSANGAAEPVLQSPVTTKCKGCLMPFRDDEEALEAWKGKWHQKCLKCAVSSSRVVNN